MSKYHNPSELDLTPNAYDAGMFHRVYAGDVYDDRYRVIRKLGYGKSATVWLVKDIATKRYLAMKVLSAECYGGSFELQELEILEHLRQADPEHPGYKHCALLLDHFIHVGPNGENKCLIFPLMAESLQTFCHKFWESCVPSKIAKRFVKQLLQALAYAHHQGVIHTDIKADNVMIKLKDEAVIEDWYLRRTEGCTDPAPSYTQLDNELTFLTWPNSSRLEPWQVPSLPMSNYYLGRSPTMDQLYDMDIVLGDWGVSTWSDPQHRLTNEVAPFVLQSPELILECPWDATVDIWQVGCLLIEMIEHRTLFTGVEFSDEANASSYAMEQYYDPETHLMQMVDLFGAFPPELLAEGNPAIVEHCFHPDGITKKEPVQHLPALHDWVSHLKNQDKAGFLELLSAILVIDPVSRCSASALLTAPWLQEEDIQLYTSKPHVVAVRESTDSTTDEPSLSTPNGFDGNAEVPQENRVMDVSEQVVDVSSEGIGFIISSLDIAVPNGHTRKKVKVSSAGIALPESHELLDVTMDDIENVPPEEPLSPSTPDGQLDDAHHDSPYVSTSFLDGSGSIRNIEPPPLEVLRSPVLPYWAEVVGGGLWFAKELLLFCVSGFGS